MHDCSVLDQQYEALTSGRHERDQRAATVEADAFSVVRQLDVLELKIQQREVQKKREEAERLRVQEQERQAAAEVAAVLERENAQWRLLEQELHEEAEQHMRLEAVRNDFEQISTFAPTVRVSLNILWNTLISVGITISYLYLASGAAPQFMGGTIAYIVPIAVALAVSGSATNLLLCLVLTATIGHVAYAGAGVCAVSYQGG